MDLLLVTKDLRVKSHRIWISICLVASACVSLSSVPSMNRMLRIDCGSFAHVWTSQCGWKTHHSENTASLSSQGVQGCFEPKCCFYGAFEKFVTVLLGQSCKCRVSNTLPKTIQLKHEVVNIEGCSVVSWFIVYTSLSLCQLLCTPSVLSGRLCLTSTMINKGEKAMRVFLKIIVAKPFVIVNAGVVTSNVSSDVRGGRESLQGRSTVGGCHSLEN